MSKPPVESYQSMLEQLADEQRKQIASVAERILTHVDARLDRLESELRKRGSL